MTYRGTVQRGVVVLEGGVTLAEGTAVEVHPLPAPAGAWEGAGVYRDPLVAGGDTSNRQPSYACNTIDMFPSTRRAFNRSAKIGPSTSSRVNSGRSRRQFGS
jgi:hypothetical protein